MSNRESFLTTASTTKNTKQLTQKQKQKQKWQTHPNEYTSLNIYLNGNAFSGKSSIIHKLIHNQFNLNTSPTSIQNFTYSLKPQYCMLSGQATTSGIISLNIHDMGGCQGYRKLRALAIGAKNWNKIQIIVYDVCDRGSFDAVGTFVDEWNRNVGKEHADSILLVGNKIDLERVGKRVVSTDEGLALAHKYGLIYLQCSAKEDVRFIFETSYYLKMIQTKKYQITDQYIEALEKEIDSIVAGHGSLYQSQLVGEIREEWENKMMVILWRLGKGYAKLGQEVGRGFERILDRYEAIYKEIQIVREMNNQQRTLSYLQKLPLTTSKSVHKLLQTISPKKSQQHALTLTKITKQLESIQEKHTKLQKQFIQILNLCGDEKIENFMTELWIFWKGKEKNSSNHVMGRESKEEKVEVGVRMSHNLVTSQQKIQAEEIETQALAASIQKQHKSYQQLAQIFTKMQNLYNEFIGTIRQQYENFDKQQSPNNNQPLSLNKSQILSQLLQFYITKTTQQLALDPNPQPSYIQLKNKISEIRQKYYNNFTVLHTNVKVLIEELRKNIIFSLLMRRRVKILRHQLRVFENWREKNRKEEEARNQRSESGISAFFSKLFK